MLESTKVWYEFTKISQFLILEELVFKELQKQNNETQTFTDSFVNERVKR